MLTNIPKIHVYSLETLVSRASGLYFPTPSWAWSLPWRWYQKVSIMCFYRASMLTKIPKIHVYSFKTLDARASGLYFATPSWAWRWYQELPVMFCHRASMLTNIPKIHVYSLKTLDARALGLHFPTPSWAWSLRWRWYKKVPMFFIELAWWPKYPKFMFTAWKLWMPGPRYCIFQHFIEPEACPEGGIKKYP